MPRMMYGLEPAITIGLNVEANITVAGPGMVHTNALLTNSLLSEKVNMRRWMLGVSRSRSGRDRHWRI